ALPVVNEPAARPSPRAPAGPAIRDGTTGRGAPSAAGFPVRTFTSGSLNLVQSIGLPHVEGRIDHMAADVKGQRLFVCALGNNTVEVVDLAAGRVTHTITGLKEPQGCAYSPDVNRLFVSNGKGEGVD